MELEVRTVLIVEDQAELNESLASSLREQNINVVTALDADSALKMLNRKVVHGVVCDIIMPGMDGMEFLGRLRSQGNNVPFIFITGFPSKENMLKAIQLGSYDFISKPFSMDEFHQSVFKLLEIGIRQRNSDVIMRKISESDENLAKFDRKIRINDAQMTRLRSCWAKKPSYG